MTIADKCARTAGYRNPAVAMAALHALDKEVKTYEEHHILAGYMEATIMRSIGGEARLEESSVVGGERRIGPGFFSSLSPFSAA